MTETKDNWHGSFLSEDDIVTDMLIKIRADAVALACWRDPVSFELPYSPTALRDQAKPTHYGCLYHAGMSIRNWYGMWRPDNPYFKISNYLVEKKDGIQVIITDPLFPDNASARIIARVRAALEQDK